MDVNLKEAALGIEGINAADELVAEILRVEGERT